MKRVLKCLFICFAILPCMFLFTGCEWFVSDSAYDIAVKNGFLGTEEEWLASLIGKNGEDGISPTIREIYNEAVLEGFEGSFMEFLDDYLSVSVRLGDEYAVSKGLLSSVLVKASFNSSSGSTGGGIIYDLNKTTGTAYIVTNYHVLWNENTKIIASNIKINVYGNDEDISATYVGGALTYDLAVIKVTKSSILRGDDTRAVTLSSDRVVLGERAIVIGNPNGDGISVSSGVVRQEAFSHTIQNLVDSENEPIIYRSIAIDTAVNPGNSGGGLFNSNGELIGIVNAGMLDNDGMGYAIPVSIVSAVTDNVIKNCSGIVKTINKGDLGIQTEINSAQAIYDENSKLVNIYETVAVKAIGKVSELNVNDVLISAELEGKIYEIYRAFVLDDLMIRLEAGSVLKLNVKRGVAIISITVILNSSEIIAVL